MRSGSGHRGRRTRGVLFVGLVATLAACSSPCERGRDEGDARTFSAGTTSANTYETGDWCDAFLAFPPGRIYRLEHRLGATPHTVNSYVAFDEHPFGAEGDTCGRGNTSESAGNQVIIERVDESIIQVRNDTCTSFFLRITAEASTPNDADGGA